jgi:hypothetical protein
LKKLDTSHLIVGYELSNVYDMTGLDINTVSLFLVQAFVVMDSLLRRISFIGIAGCIFFHCMFKVLRVIEHLYITMSKANMKIVILDGYTLNPAILAGMN